MTPIKATNFKPVFQVMSKNGVTPDSHTAALVGDCLMDVFNGNYSDAIQAAIGLLIELHEQSGSFERVSVFLLDGSIQEDGSFSRKEVYSISTTQAKRFGLI